MRQRGLFVNQIQETQQGHTCWKSLLGFYEVFFLRDTDARLWVVREKALVGIYGTYE